MNGLILDISDCFQLVFLILAVVYSAHSGNRITAENVNSKRKKINEQQFGFTGMVSWIIPFQLIGLLLR
jgi:hypothetical protein